jgi:predicted metallopeptidase
MELNQYNIDKLTIDELFRRSKKYQGTEEFLKFFKFISRFNHYSRFNTMLVYLQNESVTFFGGVNFWRKKFNRYVKEDARPYVILQPFSPVMLVYDVFQTQGRETPDEFLTKGLGTKLFEIKGKINPQILKDAITISQNWGIKILTKPLSYFNAGYITTIFKGKLEIALKEGLSYEQNLAVLIHEIAHLFLGHTGHFGLHYTDGKKKIKLFSRKLTRTVEELEAETISYLICKKLGLETRSEEYLSGYITSNDDLEQFSFELVIKTADKIEEFLFQKWTTLKETKNTYSLELF